MESDDFVASEPKKKKRRTKVSKVEKSLPDGSKRRSTVSLSLKSHTTGHGKSHIDTLDSLAKRAGFYRRITSLLSNYILSRRIDQGLDLPEINKKFYDQVWSSLNKKENEWSSLCSEFLQVCGFQPEDFPPDVKARTKESVTNEMSTVAKTMITGMFESKLRSYVKVHLYNHSDLYSSLDDKEKERDVNLIVKKILQPEFMSQEYLNIDGGYGSIIQSLRSMMVKAYEESVTTEKPLSSVIKTKPHLFLNLLCFINRDAELRSNEYMMVRDEACSIFGEDEKENIQGYVRDRGLSKRVKVSSLLPIFDLQPAFVYYSDSVVKSEFPGYDIYSFMSESFQFESIQKNMKGYSPYGFRTNGVELQVSFMALESERSYPSGTKDLDKAGYKITTPSVDVLHQKRGLFKMYQSKVDAKKIRRGDVDKIKIKSIDPGCSSVISVREISLEKCSDPRNIIESSSSWDVLGTEYSETSGRTSGQVREKRRRRRCPAYRRALRMFENVRKKTSFTNSIIEYCKVVASTLKDLYREKNRKDRRVFRMYKSRRTRSTIDKLSNRICFDRKENTERKGLKTLILFGNGSFKAKKGHASCPRKVLVRSLASRSLVGMLDEYRTSKRCPGGCGGDMEDTSDNRIRQCATDLCESPCRLSSEDDDNFRCDRDRSATINFCRIGYESLLFHKWPEHLVRDRGSWGETPVDRMEIRHDPLLTCA